PAELPRPGILGSLVETVRRGGQGAVGRSLAEDTGVGPLVIAKAEGVCAGDLLIHPEEQLVQRARTVERGIRVAKGDIRVCSGDVWSRIELVHRTDGCGIPARSRNRLTRARQAVQRIEQRSARFPSGCEIA